MNFDFRQITGTEDSKQENFSNLCTRLLMKIFPNAKPVEGKGGDEGIDTIVGTFNGLCQAFQHKYFLDKVGPSQRRQIEKSLIRAIAQHEVAKWTLMIPKDFNPSEIRWFQKLSQKYSPVEIDWWGKTKLQELLSNNADVARDFQPRPTIAMIIVNKEIDFGDENASVNKIAGLLDESIGGPTVPKRPMEILSAAAADIRRRAKLKILVWGPGPSGGNIYQKRCEIREQLQKLGHNAVFSEDLLMPELRAQTGLNLTVEELIQARALDYIVCLMASPGSIAEVHDFAKRKKLASKTMICVDDRYQKTGYSSKGTLRIFEGLHGKIDWFKNPSDITKCHLATRVLDQVQKVEEAKQWELATGDS